MPFENDENGNQSMIGEFVVAMRDLQFVRAKLKDLGVALTDVTHKASDALDLALVKIDKVGKAADTINNGPQQVARSSAAAEFATDTVIRAIKQRKPGELSRWEPVIGKNLAVTLHATPDIGFGGDGYPDPTDNALIPPREFGQLDHDRVSVGVVDTGISSHPDLAGRWSHAGGKMITSGAHSHAAGHGVFISGLIAKRAPNCELNIYGVLGENDGTASVWEVANAIASLAVSCDILNLSLSCFTKDDEPPFTLRRAIERVGPDVVAIAAAGNHGLVESSDILSPTSQSWPAAFDRVVAVAAHDGAGNIPKWSFQGPWVRLVAPGVNVTSSYLEGTVNFHYRPNETGPATKSFQGYARWSGSSFAAANVSGAIANLMASQRRMTAPEALHWLEQQPPGNPDGIWAYQASQPDN